MRLLTCTAAAVTAIAAGIAHADLDPVGRHPRTTVDLRTVGGASAFDAKWRATDVYLVPTGAGASSGSFDLHPRIGTPDFDAAPWSPIEPDKLEVRRGGGKVSFQWYRLGLTVPDVIEGVRSEGATLVLELRVDDYAEVWVDGALPYRFAQSGGSVIAGWNAPNRVTLTSDAKPGETFDVAIFAANGPISEVPDNQIWIREARLEVYANPRAVEPETVSGEIVRFDPRLDAIIAPGTAVERIATGFAFTEGPVWDRERGALLFSDPNENTIYQWSPSAGVREFMRPSGYSGADIREYHQPGSNGLTFDLEHRLTIDQHGNRRVIRVESDGTRTVLADRFEGQRLNSPNDLVYRSDGALYFTDPPFGLPKVYDDPRKETPFSGVYRLDDHGLHLLVRDLKGPNGLAFNNKETHLYVGDWDENHKVVTRYPVLADGLLGPGEVFADLTREPGDEAIDGVKVDSRGNVYVCGPGGLWIFAPDGARLGMLRNVEPPHNIAFGDPDGRTLYMTCHTGVYRVRLGVAGPMP
ncbi:MAG: SMP-30/gluconolactonase/LRE family protein [Phycisphaerales bacterium]